MFYIVYMWRCNKVTFLAKHRYDLFIWTNKFHYSLKNLFMNLNTSDEYILWGRFFKTVKLTYEQRCHHGDDGFSNHWGCSTKSIKSGSLDICGGWFPCTGVPTGCDYLALIKEYFVIPMYTWSTTVDLFFFIIIHL